LAFSISSIFHAAPLLDGLLAGDRVFDSLVGIDIDEMLQAVLLHELRAVLRAVLMGTSGKIGGNAGVDGGRSSCRASRRASMIRFRKEKQEAGFPLSRE
jgi:hypothetical protein